MAGMTRWSSAPPGDGTGKETVGAAVVPPAMELLACPEEVARRRPGRRGARAGPYLARGGPVARRTGRSGRRPGRGDRGIEGPSELALAMLLGQVRPDQLVHHEKQDDQTGRDQRQAHLSQQPPAPGEALCSSRIHVYHAKAVLRPSAGRRAGLRPAGTPFCAETTFSGSSPSLCDAISHRLAFCNT